MGARLKGGEIILLDGALGAGKTIFAKGIARALSIDTDEVTSPSFTLVNRYDEGRLTLYHLDLYRLNEGASAAHAVDLDELLTDESAVIIIEWAERMGRYPLPQPVWRVSIMGDGEESREIVISSWPLP
jgi:tRNA threonylcarbamoyladenosine biosynthesis protein TsaE